MPAVLLGGRSRRRGGGAATGTDEFNGASLAPFWTEIDPASNETVSFTGSALRLTHGATYTDLNGSMETAARIVQAKAGDFDFSVALTRDLNSNFEAFGVYVDDGTTSSYRGAFIFFDGTSKTHVSIRDSGTYSEAGPGTSAQTGDLSASTGYGRYQRLQQVGTVLRWYLSPDGVAWSEIWSGTWTGGAGQRIGFLTASNKAGSIDVDSFRVVGSGGTVPQPGSSTGPNPVPTFDTPSVPTSVTATPTAATSGANGTVALAWQPPASTGGSAITGYQVSIEPVDTAGSAAYSETASPSDRSFTFTLLSAAGYRVSVAALNAQGSSISVTATVTVGGTATTPPPPTTGDPLIVAPSQFTLTPTAGGMFVDWDDVPAPAGNFGRYEYRTGTTSPPTGAPVSTGYTSSASITGLTPGTGYYLQARSVTTGGAVGVWSAVQGPVTPQELPPPPPPGSRIAYLHPFTADSPWNLPVADAATYEAVSGPMTDRLRNYLSQWGPGINWGRYSHPVNLASAGDPLAQWTDLSHGNEVTSARTPTNVFIATGTDMHCHIVDPTRRYLDEFFAARKDSDTAYNHHRHASVSLYGKGIGPMSGTRAYGGSAIGGLLRVHEVTESDPNFKASGLTVGGRAVPLIPHALAMALLNEQLKDHTPTNRDFSYDANGYSLNTSGYVWPATETDGDGPWNYTGTIPMGAYFVLDRAVNIASMGLTWAGTALALAAQNYGIYATDRSGQPVLYMEVSASPPPAVQQFVDAAWGDLTKIIEQLRVVTNNSAATPNGGPLGSPRRAPLAANLA